MQEGILAKAPNQRLAVYAVWLKVLTGDSRDRWRPVLTDTRVVNYWDEERLAGRFFANGPGYINGAIYDWYFLFGADATWTDRPTAQVAAGTTVITKADALRQAIATVQ